MNPTPPLLDLLAREAVRRGLRPPPASPHDLDAEAVFALVREMPYRRAPDRAPATTIRAWRGTCSGKHYLLKALLEELGHDVRLLACPAWVRPEMAALLPEAERGILEEGPIPDVHNVLRLRSEAGEHLVDATAPLAWERHGLPVNRRLVPGRDMQPLFEPLEEFEIPPSAGVEGAQALKARLLEEHFSAEEVARRARFFRAIAGGR